MLRSTTYYKESKERERDIRKGDTLTKGGNKPKVELKQGRRSIGDLSKRQQPVAHTAIYHPEECLLRQLRTREDPCITFAP